jgi:hypothetical protein
VACSCSELSDIGEFVLDPGAPAPVRGEYEREGMLGLREVVGI